MGLLDDILEIFFPRREYGARSMTRLGVQVRSHAEQRIADYFESIGLRYEYERELRARFWIFSYKVSRPDFYLPDYDVYVEYWGMMDVDNNRDRRRYRGAMGYKMDRYRRMSIKLISLYPDNLKNLDWVFRRRFEKLTGKVLPPRKSARTTG